MPAICHTLVSNLFRFSVNEVMNHMVDMPQISSDAHSVHVISNCCIMCIRLCDLIEDQCNWFHGAHRASPSFQHETFNVHTGDIGTKINVKYENKSDSESMRQPIAFMDRFFVLFYLMHRICNWRINILSFHATRIIVFCRYEKKQSSETEYCRLRKEKQQLAQKLCIRRTAQKSESRTGRYNIKRKYIKIHHRVENNNEGASSNYLIIHCDVR